VVVDMPDQALIALMGETGTGKTTFANRATNSEAFLVGTGLRSCTSEIQVSPPFLVDGHPVVLIDTPGFNDTVTDDADILKSISAFLAMVYEGEVKLAGVIYFHRVSDERWRRSDTRSLGWLKRICGESTLKNVVIVTNMWGNVTPETGAAREQQLAAEFVKPVLDRGAQLHRHYDTTESTHQIIQSILKNHRAPLQVQLELIDEKREFDRTTVGKEINREVDESTRKLGGQIEELQDALMTVKGREKETRSQLEAEIAELRAKIDKLTNWSRSMNVDFERFKAEAFERFGFLLTPAGVGVGVGAFGVSYLIMWCLGLSCTVC